MNRHCDDLETFLTILRGIELKSEAIFSAKWQIASVKLAMTPSFNSLIDETSPLVGTESFFDGSGFHHSNYSGPQKSELWEWFLTVTAST